LDECAARLQPLVDQYKPRQHQTFAIEKFPIMSWGQKIFFKKVFQENIKFFKENHLNLNDQTIDWIMKGSEPTS